MAINPRTLLAKALLKNAHNPSFSWHLFKHSLSSPSANPSLQSIAAITKILANAKMDQEIDHLHDLLLRQPPEKSRVSLAVLSQTLANCGLLDKALSQFHSLRTRFPDDPPPVRLYNVLLQSSLEENRPELVSLLYKDMFVAGISPETYTFNIMIGSLCEAGRLDDARTLFDKMPLKGCQPNEFSFGIMVRGYCRVGLSLQALELLDQMGRFVCHPNLVIYNTLISGLCKEGNTAEAERLVERMRNDDLFPNIVTFNSRISALCKLGKVEEAFRIFEDMQKDDGTELPKPNLITMNVMLDGLFRAGMLEEAKRLVDQMKMDSVFTGLESYNIWLAGLARNGEILDSRLVLEDMVQKGVDPDTCSYNIVIDGLCKEGMISDAKSLLGLMRNNGVMPDTVTYSSILHGYCSREKVLEANRILQDMMRDRCFPNIYTCNILLQSLWKGGRISEAEKLLQKMNERGYGLDIVTCNIVIDGLCRSGKLDKATEIVDGMWRHGSAALGDLGNAFLGLVDNTNNGKKCTPDLISYSTIINALCKAGKLDEAKKKFIEMMGKKLMPDSAIYDTFIHGFCKHGKVSSAFRVLKDMQKHCDPSTRTYNLLIQGLGSKQQIDEIHELMKEMEKRRILPDVFTYNSLLDALCESRRMREAASFLDEMLQKGIIPNVASFSSLINGFCKACDFGAAQEVFEIALSICSQKEALYSLMFNELCTGDKLTEAKELLEAAIEDRIDVEGFSLKYLLEGLCKDDKLEEALEILNKMVGKGYVFDPASFMPVIDELSKCGKKHEADRLAETMMEMASYHDKLNHMASHPRLRTGADSIAAKSKYKKESDHRESKEDDFSRSNWQSILHRDDGSAIAMKILKRVQKGWVMWTEIHLYDSPVLQEIASQPHIDFKTSKLIAFQVLLVIQGLEQYILNVSYVVGILQTIINQHHGLICPVRFCLRSLFHQSALWTVSRWSTTCSTGDKGPLFILPKTRQPFQCASPTTGKWILMSSVPPNFSLLYFDFMWSFRRSVVIANFSPDLKMILP
ncbi:hypothetical protein ACLOJK_017227 [Asimina triloba]